MRWIEPKYRKSQIRHAGEILATDWSEESFPSFDELSEAFDVLSNWRSAHAYPMQAVLVLVRTKASNVDTNALIVQRLKRTPSILTKLRRLHGMKLERMEDIGGCRAVVTTSRHAEKLASALRNSRTRNKLHRERDYISNPKPSGYRGIHLVYRYGGVKAAFRGLSIEGRIQV